MFVRTTRLKNFIWQDPRRPMSNFIGNVWCVTTAWMEPDRVPMKGKPRLKRAAAPYVIYPEILVIVDYDGYLWVLHWWAFAVKYPAWNTQSHTLYSLASLNRFMCCVPLEPWEIWSSSVPPYLYACGKNSDMKDYCFSDIVNGWSCWSRWFAVRNLLTETNTPPFLQFAW